MDRDPNSMSFEKILKALEEGKQELILRLQKNEGLQKNKGLENEVLTFCHKAEQLEQRIFYKNSIF
ncbi:7146_t:CDS:2 [Dentiscutata erythropus]|uniref:7146_t:CDS:1 n=1 Tax=Dentiscutata erythropus TaxID=1348616 RepID=A0A9N9FVG4_9GLOM|nr:7146_t:CDS:2 [Dentiscutata erythropus]